MAIRSLTRARNCRRVGAGAKRSIGARTRSRRSPVSCPRSIHRPSRASVADRSSPHEPSRGKVLRSAASLSMTWRRESIRATSSSNSRPSAFSRAVFNPARQASSPPTMPALAERRSQRAGLMRASLPRKSRYGMRAVVRNSATWARSRSASSSSSSNPRARAAGSILGTPSRKNAGIPARSNADARWAVYAPAACIHTAMS